MRYIILLLLSVCLSYGMENPFAETEYIIEEEYKVKITRIKEDWVTGKVQVKIEHVSMILKEVLKLKHRLSEDEWIWFFKFGTFNLLIYDTII